eukprot:jgi/Phyca11/112027/e_gw1.21.614.1
MASLHLVGQSTLCLTVKVDQEAPLQSQGRTTSSTHFRIEDSSATSSLNACASYGDTTPSNRSEISLTQCSRKFSDIQLVAQHSM